jgi:MFS family permease
VTLTVEHLPLFSLLLLAAFFLMSLAIPNLTACTADVIVASSRGLGFALIQFLVTVGGAFGPLIVGGVSDAVGSLTAAMYALVLPQVVGALMIIRGRRHYERDAGRVLDEARRGGTG